MSGATLHRQVTPDNSSSLCPATEVPFSRTVPMALGDAASNRDDAIE